MESFRIHILELVNPEIIYLSPQKVLKSGYLDQNLGPTTYFLFDFGQVTLISLCFFPHLIMKIEVTKNGTPGNHL